MHGNWTARIAPFLSGTVLCPYLQERAIYFLGNSLGTATKNTQEEILKIMDGWANFGVEGFFLGNDPWLNYQNISPRYITNIVGAKAEEIVTMNHLTVNLHLLMISFYRPTKQRGIRSSVKQRHFLPINMLFSRR